MIGDEVENHPYAALAGLTKESLGVGVGAVARSDHAEIHDIVAGIEKRVVVNRIQTEGIDSERGDVVEFLDATLEIADAVAIGVQKRLRGDLIKEGRFKPLRP